ncbi:MAG TPA: VWA domain-containing protein [Bryobacteraceae bacterium]|jgi:VWFA-related protein
MQVPRWIAGGVAIFGLAYGQVANPPPAPAAQQNEGHATISTTAEEVVLDLIVRDKRGRAVKDLRPEEIQITDGDRPATVKSVRFTELEQASAEEQKGSKHIDPMRQVRLITLLFDSLTVEPALQARAAAHELVKAGTGPNVYFSILRMAGRLQPLQEFTNDGPALHKAIDKYVGGKANFLSQAEAVESRLRNMSGGDGLTTQQLLGADTSTIATANSPNAPPADPVAIPMANLLLNIVMTATQDAKEIQGRPILGALRAAADQQKQLPGRKTIVYFTEGWNLTYALKEQFEALISAANRANVSFYVVDAGGLVTGARNEAAAKMLRQAAALSAQQGGPATTFEQARGVDTALESMNANTQTALMDLAGSTGGTFISDSNDLRKPMVKLAEDVNSYYEVNYVPDGRQMDGHLRTIKVKVDRPGVKIQSRSGYYDLPHGSSNLKGMWEVSALRALEEKPSRQEFTFHAKAFALRRTPTQVTGELVYQIPISALEPEQNQATKVFKLRFGVVALFRNVDGKIIQKLSRETGHEGALDAWERAKAANYYVTQSFDVPPGAYTVEVAAIDAVSSKTSVIQIPVSFGAESNNGGLDLGGPLVVERLDPVADLAASDPLRYEKARVLPSVAAGQDGYVINPKTQQGLPLYFLIRQVAASTAAPELTLDLKRDGEPFTSIKVPLPAAKPGVEIPYVMTLPTAALGGGRFQLQAKVRQGDATVERELDFAVAGEPRALARSQPSVAGKITSGAAAEAEEEPSLPVTDVVAAALHADMRPKKEDEILILDGARKRAIEYTTNLPNFVCMQVTSRFERPIPRRLSNAAPVPVAEDWKQIDTLAEQLTYLEGHEHYKKIDGAQRGDDMGRGVLSNGEFGTLLRMVFRPESKTTFQWHDLALENGRKLHIFEFSIPRATSEYMIRPSHGSAAVPVAAKGTVTIDAETYEIKKIDLAAVNLPKKFPFQESVIEVEYDTVNIGDQFSLLPKQATVHVTAGKKMNRNTIEYLNYRKWTGTSELKFGDPVAPTTPPVKKQQ